MSGYSSRRFTDSDIFADAKRVACGPIAEAAGAILKRIGPRLVGTCPACGGDKGATRFQITIATNLFICRACGIGGSSVDLEMALGGGTSLEAARRLVGDAALVRVEAPRLGAPSPPRKTSSAMAQKLWSEAQPAAGTIVERWFEARGIDPALVAEPLSRLRFHPNAFAGGERKAIGNGWAWVRNAPALIAPIIDTAAEGKLVGVHATYLTSCGTAKADLRAPNGDTVASRKMWGRSQGGVCALTNLRAINRRDYATVGDGVIAEVMPPSMAPLFVGEGLETTLSAFAHWQAKGENVRAAAVLSLDNLQGGWLKDDDGCATHWPPRIDPERKPWTLDNPGRVIVIVDRDMSAIYAKRRDETGKPKRHYMNADARAQLCTDLATQAWRAAGAESVDCTLPLKTGADLNDMVRQA